MILGVLRSVGHVCLLPLQFGVLLLGVFIAYCILLAWLSLFPIFSGRFRAMCNVWFWGLRIVLNKRVWITAGIGAFMLLIVHIFS